MSAAAGVVERPGCGGLAPLLEPARGRIELDEVGREPFAVGFGLSVEAVKLEQAPVPNDRPQDVVVMDAQVEDAGLRHRGRLAQVTGDGRAGHVEREHLGRDRLHGRGRPDLDGRGEDVPVEQRMEVLVLRDPEHDPVRHGVLRVLAGVAVREARRQLLERHVRQPAKRVGRGTIVARLHQAHPLALKQNGVDVAGDHEVVPEDDRMATLLRGPAADPVDPRPITAAEHAVDQAVVAGQVVLREEADLERDLGDTRQPGLVGRPGLLVEVPSQSIGDVVVREPLLRHLGVPVVQPTGLRLQLQQQCGGVVHSVVLRAGDYRWRKQSEQ